MRSLLLPGAMLLSVALFIDPSILAAEPSPLATTLRSEQLDAAAFAQWSEGKESPVDKEESKNGPSDVLWTVDKRPEWRGVEFGTSRTPGKRHLRIGFKEPQAIGSVLVRGGAALSVLKADAPYPGDLANEAQWQAAERLPAKQTHSRDDYGLWVLPPGTQSRALRFTHVSAASDQNPAGWLGGAAILGERLANIAPQGLAAASARTEAAGLLNDESNNKTWAPWDNGEKGAAVQISPEHPETITLTWSKPVKLSGLCLLWAGFGKCEADAYVGSGNTPIQSATAKDWQPVGGSTTVDPFYPMALGPNWVNFDKTVETRAVRLRITGPSQANHPHIADKLKAGKLVWLGELMALMPLDNAPLSNAKLPPISTEIPPPIPVKFTLSEPGLVTLVIEDAAGQRIRNLVSETPYPAGENIAWWDGSDDLLRDPEAAKHGLYHLPTRFVSPGKYTVRGLVRKPLALTYEQSVYSAGKPAWETADKTGCWMTNHTPPTSIATVPGSRTADGQPLVFMGAFVAEGGHGLQWVREDGTKVGGQGWVGGNWTGAPTLAVDLGKQANTDHLCYAASVWEGELRITAKTKNFQDKAVLKTRLGDDPHPDQTPSDKKLANLVGFDGGDRTFVLAGIAAHDGVVVCSLVRQNQLLFVSASTGEVLRKHTVENPRGVAFDKEGKLLVLSGTKLIRLNGDTQESLIASGLEDPRHVALDAAGNIYLSDRGSSHQVKVFSPAGKLLHTIGKPGAPAVGLYDPLHMNNPNGLALDSQGQLWIAEDDFHPKRVSVWSREGKLLRAYYGPGEYGGGGVLDPQDPTRFFYKGQEFQLDRERGTDVLLRVFYRPAPLLEAHYGPYSPDTPLYPPQRKGERYFTSCFTHNPTNGDGVSFIWRDGKSVAKLVAAFGNAQEWAILKTQPFHARWPKELDPTGDRHRNSAVFTWSDANGDTLPQPEEVTISKGSCSGVVTQNDLSCVVAQWNGQTAVFSPTKFNEHGAPQYDIAAPQVLVNGAQSPRSSGGDQALTEPGGWTIHTVAPEPFSPYGLGGSFQGQPRWTYPNAWPGLHASHEAAIPDRLGMVIGTTRLLGGWIKPRGDAGPLFAINGNMGNIYLFTADGLFVATLFHDIRLRPNWAMPKAVRGMDVGNVSLHDENFWPSITQTASGDVFVVDGARVSLVRVAGLDTIRRLPSQSLEVTTNDLTLARDWFAQAEAQRQALLGSGTLKVALDATAPTVDGDLKDWPLSTAWATIDRRGTAANFNSDSRPYDASAAVNVSDGYLYAAWRTNEKDLLKNSGESPEALFKTGGALDLMLRTDAKAESAETVAGDLRLLVTQVGGKTQARLYRARVAGTKEPVKFSSPWRTITIDAVDDISEQVQLAADGKGHYELRVPLKALGWSPAVGQTYRADLGLLRGDGRQTTQRVYWSNKATAITADVPSEAELTPRLWGRWEMIAP